MKKLLLLLFIVPLVGIGQEEKIFNEKEIKIRYDWDNGVKNSYRLVACLKGDKTKTPFTGKVKYLDKKNKGYKLTSFKDGVKEGIAIAYYGNGQLRYEGMFSNDKPVGNWKSWYEKGQLESDTNFKDGKQDGLWKFWWGNGKLQSEATYKDDEMDGIYKYWWDNGHMREERGYKNGKFHGTHKWWDKDGILKSEIIYKEGMFSYSIEH